MRNWAIPLHHPKLGNDEVHVWRAELEIPEEYIQALRQTLAEDERKRAVRFRFEKDQRHFTAARGILRTLLGRYLHMQPSSLQFGYNRYGKPCLANGEAGNTLRFNLSHSHGMALFAFTHGREVGVDLEYMLKDRAEMSIARRFFSPHEVEALSTLPAEQQTRAFFACWTRKEAYVKARGLGLSLDLNLFDVSLRPNEPAALLNICEPGQRLEDWLLHDLAPADEYAGALAVMGAPARVTCWEWRVS